MSEAERQARDVELTVLAEMQQAVDGNAGAAGSFRLGKQVMNTLLQEFGSDSECVERVEAVQISVAQRKKAGTALARQQAQAEKALLDAAVCLDQAKAEQTLVDDTCAAGSLFSCMPMGFGSDDRPRRICTWGA